jgi:hypothetical protein
LTIIAAKGKGKRAEIELHAEILPSIYPVIPVNNFQSTDDPIGNLLESRSTNRVGLPSSCNRVSSTAAFAGSRLHGWLVFSRGEREREQPPLQRPHSSSLNNESIPCPSRRRVGLNIQTRLSTASTVFLSSSDHAVNECATVHFAIAHAVVPKQQCPSPSSTSMQIAVFFFSFLPTPSLHLPVRVLQTRFTAS